MGKITVHGGSAAPEPCGHRIVTATEVTDDATTTKVVEAGRVVEDKGHTRVADSESERRPAPRKATDAAASRGTTRK